MASFDLAERLADREICHPTVVSDIVVRKDKAMTITVSGTPWWRKRRADDGHQCTLEVVFGGLSNSSFQFSDLWSTDEEDLEDFRILSTDDLTFLQGACCSIYANAPVPEPLLLFEQMHDSLTKSSSPFGPADFLNMGPGARFDYFRLYLSQPSALVAHGYSNALQPVRDELSRQGVPFTEQSGHYEELPPLLVKWNGGWFFCDSVVATEV